jgi:hypothetical protein
MAFLLYFHLTLTLARGTALGGTLLGASTNGEIGA